MKQNPLNTDSQFRPSGGSKVVARIRVSLRPYIQKYNTYDAGRLDRDLTELVRTTPPAVVFELHVGNLYPCELQPLPFAAPHTVVVLGNDPEVIRAWYRHLAGPPIPPAGAGTAAAA